jgi:hypothetical protein
MKKATVFAGGIVAGLLFFIGAATSLAGGSFFIDDITSFVGIGNTTPQSRLDVSGAIYSRLVTASSTSINWNMGNVQTMTLSSNPTLTFNNGQAGGEYKLILVQDGTGGRNITWPASVLWEGGNAPTLTSAASSIDSVKFVYDGSHYLGSSNLNYSMMPSSLLNNLVAYWKLDESSGNALDATGNGNTLTNNNSSTYASGKINNAIDFGSSNTVNNLSTNGSSAIGYSMSNHFTASFWTKINTAPSTSTGYYLWAAQNASHANRAQVVYTNNAGTLQLSVSCGDQINIGGQGFAVNQTFTPGTWYLVTLTWDGSTCTAYVNGSSVGNNTESIANGTGAFNDDFTIGSLSYSGSGPTFYGAYSNAAIDEFGWWSRALTSGEITTLYYGGAGKQYPF